MVNVGYGINEDNLMTTMRDDLDSIPKIYAKGKDVLKLKAFLKAGEMMHDK